MSKMGKMTQGRAVIVLRQTRLTEEGESNSLLPYCRF